MAEPTPDELLETLRKGADFAHRLLEENKRLQYRLLELERDLQERERRASDSELVRTLAELERKRDEMELRLRQVEEENAALTLRYNDIENQINNFANLYIAGHQLHSSMDLNEVLEILSEIIINLIGTEEFAIMLCDKKGQNLQVLAAHGGPNASSAMPVRFAHEVANTQIFIDPAGLSGTGCAAAVRIPLVIKDRPVGLIELYRFLRQKTKFTDLDHDLFEFLQRHAAIAILGAQLYSEAKQLFPAEAETTRKSEMSGGCRHA